MASKQVSSAFRLGSTHKLWGFIHKLDKRKSSEVLMVLKNFLQYYFLRKVMYVLQFFFYFTRYYAELYLAAVGSIRTVRKESKIWFPKRPKLTRRRRWLYSRQQPYRKIIRVAFEEVDLTYQSFLRRRKIQLKWFRRFRKNLAICAETTKFSQAKHRMLRKLRRTTSYKVKQIARWISERNKFKFAHIKRKLLARKKNPTFKNQSYKKVLHQKNKNFSQRRKLGSGKKKRIRRRQSFFFGKSRAVFSQKRALKIIKQKLVFLNHLQGMKDIIKRKPDDLVSGINTQWINTRSTKSLLLSRSSSNKKLWLKYNVSTTRMRDPLKMLRRQIYHTFRYLKMGKMKAERNEAFVYPRSIRRKHHWKSAKVAQKYFSQLRIMVIKLYAKFPKKRSLKLALSRALKRIIRNYKIVGEPSQLDSLRFLAGRKIRRSRKTVRRRLQRRRQMGKKLSLHKKTKVKKKFKKLRKSKVDSNLKTRYFRKRKIMKSLVRWRTNAYIFVKPWSWRDKFRAVSYYMKRKKHRRNKFVKRLGSITGSRLTSARGRIIRKIRASRALRAMRAYERKSKRGRTVGHQYVRFGGNVYAEQLKKRRWLRVRKKLRRSLQRYRRRRQWRWRKLIRKIKQRQQKQHRLARFLKLGRVEDVGGGQNRPFKKPLILAKRQYFRQLFSFSLYRLAKGIQKEFFTKGYASFLRYHSVKLMFSKFIFFNSQWGILKNKSEPNEDKRLKTYYSFDCIAFKLQNHQIVKHDVLDSLNANIIQEVSACLVPARRLTGNFIKRKRYFFLISSLILSARFSRLLGFPVWVRIRNIFNLVSTSWKIFYKRVVRWTIYATFLHKSLAKVLKRIMLIMIFSFRFQTFFRFMKILGFLFNRHRRQQRVIRQFFRIIIKKSLFRFKRLLGWQLNFRGKMNRRPRARQLTWWRYRKPALQDNTMQIIYSARAVVTDFGMYYFRMWVYYWE